MLVLIPILLSYMGTFEILLVLLPGYVMTIITNSGLYWRMWRIFVLLSGCKREIRGVKMKRLCFGPEKN